VDLPRLTEIRHRQRNALSCHCSSSRRRRCRRIERAIRYTYRAGEREPGVSHWSGKQDNPLGSFYRMWSGGERDIQDAVPFSLLYPPHARDPRDPSNSHGDSANAHGRSPVSRTAGINELYVYGALRRNAKEGDRSAARRLSCPKTRPDVCRLSRRLNGDVFPQNLCSGALLVSSEYLANSVRRRF